MTVYLSNDGVHYTASAPAADGFPPQLKGQGTTFEYYGPESFRDPVLHKRGCGERVREWQTTGSVNKWFGERD